MTYKEAFMEFMVRAGVLTFGDFTTKSGRKTPYFINTGNYRTGAQIDALGRYYAACIQENLVAAGGADALFGPAYKGIPLVAAAAGALYREYKLNLPWFFNRKEQKNHGEGGSLVGYQPSDGDRIAIIEDVVTAGTAVRETLALFQSTASLQVTALFVSVDRMERGSGSRSALQELEEDYGIHVFPLVTVRDIMTYLHNRPVDGKIYIDDTIFSAMEAYLKQYGAATAEAYNRG